MTLVATITALSERVLTERTFELIVAPAVADVQFDGDARGIRRARNGAALVSAFAWGLYEDITSDSAALATFAALTLLPAAYYTSLVIVFLRDVRLAANPTAVVILPLAIAVLSLGPAVACYWPERPARQAPDAAAAPSAEG